MPALAASQEMQERAAALGYDWPDVDGRPRQGRRGARRARARRRPSRAAARSSATCCWSSSNVGRKLGIESEAALRAANDEVPASASGAWSGMVAERGVAMRDLDFATLDELWDAAKAEERARDCRGMGAR